MIGVVDYSAGNIASVANALTTLGVEFAICPDVRTLARCDGIILPGVGAAPGAMASLRQRELTEFLSTTKTPLLGICLGMQVLFQYSEEGSANCLGVLPGTVKRCDGNFRKVPHMGWNAVVQVAANPIMDGLGEREHFYFAHSYYTPGSLHTTATTNEGVTFTAAIRKDNYFGVQFHPEKSGSVGLKLLKNFIEICRSFQR
jgi:glutamine amidotransferase